MNYSIKNLLRDESGFVVSTELILITTILVIGIVVGQATLRDQIVTEMADAADAISAVDQSYQYAATVADPFNGSTLGSVAGSSFADLSDFCDTSDSGQQGLDAGEGACVVIDDGDDSGGVQATVGSDSP